jgi:hypothetical protein
MRRFSGSPIKAACAVLTAAGIAFLAQNPLSAPPQAAGSDPAAAAVAPISPMEVNRALKGDRLRVILRPEGAEPFDVQAPPATVPGRALPDGCESAFGPINPGTKPARCVT